MTVIVIWQWLSKVFHHTKYVWSPWCGWNFKRFFHGALKSKAVTVAEVPCWFQGVSYMILLFMLSAAVTIISVWASFFLKYYCVQCDTSLPRGRHCYSRLSRTKKLQLWVTHVFSWLHFGDRFHWISFENPLVWNLVAKSPGENSDNVVVLLLFLHQYHLKTTLMNSRVSRVQF